eukprot:sb/3476944/
MFKRAICRQNLATFNTVETRFMLEINSFARSALVFLFLLQTFSKYSSLPLGSGFRVSAPGVQLAGQTSPCLSVYCGRRVVRGVNFISSFKVSIILHSRNRPKQVNYQSELVI